MQQPESIDVGLVDGWLWQLQLQLQVRAGLLIGVWRASQLRQQSWLRSHLLIGEELLHRLLFRAPAGARGSNKCRHSVYNCRVCGLHSVRA